MTAADPAPPPLFRPAPLPAVTLRAVDLTVDRGGRRVLEGLSFTLRPGEAILLTGANGTGKSTLIRALLGLVVHTAGTIAVEGETIEEPSEIGAACHHLGHRDALKPALTVGENLAFWRDFLGGGTGAGIDAALDAVDLLDLADLPAAYLSAGQGRRLAIARLLVVARPIWLLDEPTAALDAASEQRLTALMRAHLVAGGSLLAATHLPLDLPGARALRLSASRAA